VCFIDDDSNTSSPFSNQPTTPDDNDIDHASATMPMTSPIDIATPTRNASSSPSSQGKKPVYHDIDSRNSAMMSGTAFDSSMGRGRQDSFGGAKPISMNNPNRNNDGRPRRESLAGSLVQGMSWGGVSVGSWIRDEWVFLRYFTIVNCAFQTISSLDTAVELLPRATALSVDTQLTSL
jgi:transcription factor SFP1